MAELAAPAAHVQPNTAVDIDVYPSATLHTASTVQSKWEGGYGGGEEGLQPLEQQAIASSLEQPLPTGTKPRRLLYAAYYGVLSVLTAWDLLSLVRYTIATREFRDDAQRTTYAAVFTALSTVSLLILVANFFKGFMVSFQTLYAIQQGLFAVASVFLLVPTLFNLAFVSLWHSRSPVRSTMALRGRCKWHADVVWAGRAGQCASSVPWGAWLSGAIIRFLLIFTLLTGLHWIVWRLYVEESTSRRASPKSRPRSHSTMSLMGSTTSASNKLRRKRPTPEPLNLPSSSASSSQDHRRTFSSSSNTHNQGSLSALTYIPNHLTRPSPSQPSPPTVQFIPGNASVNASSSRSPPSLEQPRASTSSAGEPGVGRLSPTSDISEQYSDVDDGGDLNRFAANFRSLVERVSRETDEGALPSTAQLAALARPPMIRSNSTPNARRSPSPQSSRRSSLQMSPSEDPTLQLQHELLNAHRRMLIEQAMRTESYEHVLMLGGAVRRMSTIASMADGNSEREPPWTPTSAASFVTPKELTRSPTASTARSGRRNPAARRVEPPDPEAGPSNSHSNSNSSSDPGSGSHSDSPQ